MEDERGYKHRVEELGEEVAESPEEDPSGTGAGLVPETLEKHVSGPESLTTNKCNCAEDRCEDSPGGGNIEKVEEGKYCSKPSNSSPNGEGVSPVGIESPSEEETGGAHRDDPQPEGNSPFSGKYSCTTGINLGLGDSSEGHLIEGVESSTGEERTDHSDEDDDSSFDAYFISELESVGSGGLKGPDKGDQEGEDGTNKSPDLVGLDAFAHDPKEESSKAPGELPDTSDFTGVGAVGEVVSGGNISQLTSESNIESEVTEETGPGEAPEP